MTVPSPLHSLRRRVVVALTSCLGFAHVTPARADVLVVDAAGGGQFIDIQPAVLAAQDGDSILVRTGVYGPFDLRAKALDIVAYEGADVRVVGTTRVRGLVQGREIVLSGLALEGHGFGANVPVLWLQSNQGSVRLVDCTVVGENADVEQDPGGTGCRVEQSAAVAFFHCTIQGGMPLAGFCIDRSSGDGLAVIASTVELYGTSVAGGDLAIFNLPLGGDGGTAVIATVGSVLRIFSSTLRGTDGGDGDIGFTNCTCGNGGDALVIDATSAVDLHDSPTIRGEAGLPTIQGSCSPGVARSGPVTDLVGAVRSLETERVVRLGGQIDMTIQGVPGDGVFLLLSTHANQQYYPALLGVLHVGAPYIGRAVPVGQIGANGELRLSGGVTGFAPGLTAEHLYVQPFIISSSGRWLGHPDVVIVLAPGV